MTFENLVARVRRVLSLDETAFQEVRDDPSFTFFSILAAGIAVFLAAIGAWLWAETAFEGSTPDGWFLDTIILGTIFTVVLFLIGVGVIYLMLAQAFGEEVPLDAIVRVTTLTHIPYALGLLIFIPEIGFAFGLLSVIATFYYTVFGLRAAWPDIDRARVLISVLTGFAAWLIILPIISSFPDNNFVTGVFVYSLFE